MTSDQFRRRKYYLIEPFGLKMSRKEIEQTFNVSQRTVSYWLTDKTACLVYMFKDSQIHQIRVFFKEIDEEPQIHEKEFVKKWSR